MDLSIDKLQLTSMCMLRVDKYNVWSIPLNKGTPNSMANNKVHEVVVSNWVGEGEVSIN